MKILTQMKRRIQARVSRLLVYLLFPSKTRERYMRESIRWLKTNMTGIHKPLKRTNNSLKKLT
jgi:hypothetical protein